MGYGAACRLFALMVRNAAVHRREQSRSAGENRRSTPCRVGRSEKDAPRHLALDFTGWDQGYFGTAKRITSSQEGAPHHSTRVSVREGARSCFSKRAILTGSAFDSVSRHLRRVSLTHLATTSLRHVRIRNKTSFAPCGIGARCSPLCVDARSPCAVRRGRICWRRADQGIC